MSKKKSHTALMVGLSVVALAGLAVEDAQAQNINCPQPLIFGDLVTCASANTIVVRPDNTRQVNGCLSAGGAPFSRARCVVTQKFPFRPVQISVTAATYVISNGTDSMNVNNFNIVTNAGGATTTITAPVINVPIGATLNVNNPQAGGTYTGTFTVNANRL